MAFEVDLRDFRRVVIRLIEHAQDKRGSDTLVVEEDFSWHVPHDWRYTIYENPDLLTIGSIHDDWEFCRVLVDPERQPVSLLLDGLVSLLSYLAFAVRFLKAYWGRLPAGRTLFPVHSAFFTGGNPRSRWEFSTAYVMWCSSSAFFPRLRFQP